MVVTEPRTPAVATKTGDQAPNLESEHQLTIKNVDMDHDMQREVVSLANAAIKKCHNEEMAMARHIKEGMDDKFLPMWHCCVGRKYGSHVTHEANYFMYFNCGNYAFLVFKSRD